MLHKYRASSINFATNTRKMEIFKPTCLFLVLTVLSLHRLAAVAAIGVNYGTLADNLPPPAQVAQFLKEKTIIDKVKIFDVNPDIIRAFANTGISVTVTIPNGEIPALTDAGNARRYVEEHIKPFYPATKFDIIAVGNEILHWGPQNLIDNLVPAMRAIHKALLDSNIRDVKVSTPHSLGILYRAKPPMSARFRSGWDVGVLKPMLEFLSETKSPFMVNPYPYFAFDPKELDFDVFRPSKTFYDRFSKKTYTNKFDILMDAVWLSMRRLGHGEVEILVAETGWPSAGETFEPQCNPANAAAYNGGLVRKFNSGAGTPLQPGKKFDTYLFALFNENQKPGSIAERNWGLFQPDFTPVYDAGIMKAGAGGKPAPTKPSPATPSPSGKKYCVPKAGATEAALQSNINYLCDDGKIDCHAIREGGSCFTPNSVRSHAAFVMNAWFQKNGPAAFNCDFSGTGEITTTNPSHGACAF